MPRKPKNRKKCWTHRQLREMAVSKPNGAPSHSTQFPLAVDKIFVISIRPQRWKDFQTRMGSWAANAVRFEGSVDGRTLDRKQLRQAKIIDSKTKLTRGQIGCFLSHLALWKHVCGQKLNRVLICEDDAAIYRTKPTERLLTRVGAQMKRHPCHFVMLGHHARGAHHRVSANLEWVTDMVGLFAYVATRAGLAKLLRIKMTSFRLPIDNMLSRFALKRYVNAVRTKPAVCFVTTVVSDTQNIK